MNINIEPEDDFDDAQQVGTAGTCECNLSDFRCQINPDDSYDAEFMPSSLQYLNPESNIFPGDPVENVFMNPLTVVTGARAIERKIKRMQSHNPTRASKKTGHDNPESSDSATEDAGVNQCYTREFWFIENENKDDEQFPAWEVAYNYCHHKSKIDKYNVYTPHLGIEFTDSDIVDEVHYKTTDAEYWDYGCDAQFDVVDCFPEDFQKQRQLNWLCQKIFESDNARDLIIVTRNSIHVLEEEILARLECKSDIRKQIKRHKLKNPDEKFEFRFLKMFQNKKHDHVATPIEEMREIHELLCVDLAREKPELKKLKILLKTQVQSYMTKLREIKRQKNINLLEVLDEMHCLLQSRIAERFHRLGDSEYLHIKHENGVSFERVLCFENQLRTKRLEIIGMRCRYLQYKERQIRKDEKILDCLAQK
jgi:hypothetical protein